MQIITGSVHARLDKVKYLFIDGAYFRKVIEGISKKYFKDVEIPVDFKKVSSGFRKTFYYDCLQPKNTDETQEDYEKRILPQKRLFNLLRALPGFHVNEGIIVGEKDRIRQKQIDIMIAVGMMTHSFRKNMEETALLTGDLDFKPLIGALVSDGMYVTLWYEKASTNENLIYAADTSMPINIQVLYNWSSTEFQRKYKLPHAVSTSSNETGGYSLVKSGETEEKGHIELYKKDEQYCVVIPDTYNLGHKIYIKFDNLEFLETYVQDVHCNFEWN